MIDWALCCSCFGGFFGRSVFGILPCSLSSWHSNINKQLNDSIKFLRLHLEKKTDEDAENAFATIVFDKDIVSIGSAILILFGLVLFICINIITSNKPSLLPSCKLKKNDEEEWQQQCLRMVQ